MEKVIYDVIIIGGGPAGLTCAIYTARERLSTLLLEKAMCGGLPALTERIENYPGFPQGISGADLIRRFREQAERFGTIIREYEEVQKVGREGEVFKVQTTTGEYLSRSLVVASGSVPKELGVPGEKEFRGRGVSYCALCDAPFFKDKDIAVIGCGNSGLQEGEFLLKYAKSVTFVEFLPYIPGERILQERLLQEKDRVRFFLNHGLTSINGKDFVRSITIQDRETREEKEIPVAGVFVYVGFLPNTAFLKGMVDMDEDGYILTDEEMRTSHPGIFAIGDVRSKKVRQITTACGDGTISAVSVKKYLLSTSPLP